MALTTRSRKGKAMTARIGSRARMARQNSNSISSPEPLPPAIHPFLRFSHSQKGLDAEEKLLTLDSQKEHVVRFNISGRSYLVLRKTLGRLTFANRNGQELALTEDGSGVTEGALYKDMMGILCRFADPKTPIDDLIAISDGYFLESQEFFFERSPEVFEALLHFYRTGRLHPPSNMCTEMFGEELRFWNISPSLISQCCRKTPCHQNSKGSLLRGPRKRAVSIIENKSSEISGDPPEYSPNNSLINKDSGAMIGYQDKQRISLEGGTPPANGLGNAGAVDNFDGVCLENFRKSIWFFMEDPQRSKASKFYSLLSVTVVLVSVLDLIIASLQDFQVKEHEWSEAKPHPILMYIEAACIVWFTMEYLVRLLIVKNRMAFIKTPLNIVDCLSVLPFYVEFGLEVADIRTENLDNVKGALMVLRILRVLRVARIFKLAKYSGGLQSFGHTLKASYKEIWMLVLFMSITIVLFSTTVYFLEKDTERTNFTSIPATFWWCIVTMTTVGYGDMYPRTLGGKLVASLTSVSGVIVLAFPITIIVENFNKYYRTDDENTEEESSLGDEEELLSIDVERRVFNTFPTHRRSIISGSHNERNEYRIVTEMEATGEEPTLRHRPSVLYSKTPLTERINQP